MHVFLQPVNETLGRSALKGLTWRIVSTATTIVLALTVLKGVEVGSGHKQTSWRLHEQAGQVHAAVSLACTMHMPGFVKLLYAFRFWHRLSQTSWKPPSLQGS